MGFSHQRLYERIDKLMLESLGKMLEIVPRHEWNAREAQGETEMYHPLGNVVVWYIRKMPGCQTDEECKKNMLEQQRRDLAKGMADIKYNFLIGGNGKVYEGRGWLNRPSSRLPYTHLKGNRMDIGHFGFYTKETLPYLMIDAQNKLIESGVHQEFIGKMHKIIDNDH